MIDTRAIVDSNAKIASDVSIGPWSIIGPHVEIGSGTWIGPHVIIKGHTKIGKNNKIYQFSSIGEDPQHLQYKGEPTTVEIGDNNIIREFSTINKGTVQGGGVTRFGDNNFVMAYVHIAHDCSIGSNTIFVNNASLAGHVVVNDHAIIGGYVGIHQFCKVGAHSFITAAMVGKDVPPYVIVTGNTAKVCGLNTVGLKRKGFAAETIAFLRRAYNIIYRKGNNVQQAIVELKQMVLECPEVQLFVDALSDSTRGIVR